jgi:hypothetical protein
MKNAAQKLIHWLPFAFAVYLCYSTLWRLSASDMKVWEPAFYSFLPMCFFVGGFVTYRMEREIRELREQIAKLTSIRVAGSNVA